MPETTITKPQSTQDFKAQTGECPEKITSQAGAKLRSLVARVRTWLIWIWSRIALGARAITAPFQKLPRKIQFAVGLAIVLLIGLGILSWKSAAASAKLHITCQHTFRSAELSVWVDSSRVYVGTINGSAKKRLGIFNSKSQGVFSKTVAVPAGKHLVQVRLNSPVEGYDQIKTQGVTFSDNDENSLTVSAGKRGLYIMAQGGSTPAEAPAAPYQKYVGSVLFSILGSGMSATIGFLVQEFLRGQKQRLANSSSTAQPKN